MKRLYHIVYIGIFLLLAGCNGIGGGGAIVGDWEVDCTQLEGDTSMSMREEISYLSDGTYTGRSAYFSDVDCSNRTKMYVLNGRYETGGSTTGDDGEAAVEINFYNSEGSSSTWKVYGMYRLTDNDTLLVAGGREGHDGTNESKRRDHFYIVWKRK